MATSESIPTSDDPEVVKSSDSSSFLDTAKRAYSSGMETAQTRLKQAGGVVREGAHKASETSKDMYSKATAKMGDYSGKAQQKAVDYHGNISRALAAPRSGDDSEGEPVKFPLSIVTWCSSLCGSKKAKVRDMDIEPAVEQSENPDAHSAHHHDDVPVASA